jgi:ribonuclease P protein subunit RPR2
MVNGKNSRKKTYIKKTAKQRLEKLFIFAEKYSKSNRFDLADRYVEIARSLSMRYLVPIPKKYKRCFCKHCYSYLRPGVNCKIRINRKKLIIYCGICKKFTRILLEN